jgi:myo-inositol-1(or 4)-monophosphatase
MLGVVYDPVHDECFTAERSGPALLNGNPVAVSMVDDLRHAQLSTGFPYDRWTRADSNAETAASMVMQCQDLRRMGSAALDLCYVATGRHDGHWEVELKPWDGAAGALIIQAAGGEVTDVAGKRYSPWGGGVVASNRLIHNAMLNILSKPNEQRV